MEKIAFDLYSQEYQQNPYPTLAHFQKQDPIHPFTMTIGEERRKGWLITRYQDVITLLKSKKVTKDVMKVVAAEREPSQLEQQELDLLTNNMLFKDPPDHSRLRTLVHKVFTPKMIVEMKGQIEEISLNLIKQMKNNLQPDLLEDYAVPLPVTVISEMMGIPEEDRERFREWSTIITNASNGTDAVTTFQASIREFTDYLEHLIEKRRKTPGPDIISGLVSAEEAGEKLTHKELLSMLFLLIVAGHETTVNLIGNGMLSLMDHRDQFNLLKRHPEHTKTAVEELLRFTNPVEFATTRYVAVDFSFHGHECKKGDFLFLSLAAANRDPEQFHQPDKLDITRKPNKHLSFGNGIHFCLGAPLARLEGEIAFQHLLQHFPTMHLRQDAQIHWRHSEIFRGLTALPVQW